MKKRILVVDNDYIQRKALDFILSNEGYDVQTAESGEAGLALYVKSRFDLVITELRMTGMDGSELLRQLREFDSRTRVLILTAHST